MTTSSLISPPSTERAATRRRSRLSPAAATLALSPLNDHEVLTASSSQVRGLPST